MLRVITLFHNFQFHHMSGHRNYGTFLFSLNICILYIYIYTLVYSVIPGASKKIPDLVANSGPFPDPFWHLGPDPDQVRNSGP